MFHGREAIQNLHVLVVRGSGILFIGGDVELMASLDGDVLITDSVSGTDLRSFLNSGQICNAAVSDDLELTVSRAMATGRPVCEASACRAWSITDWWY